MRPSKIPWAAVWKVDSWGWRPRGCEEKWVESYCRWRPWWLRWGVTVGGERNGPVKLNTRCCIGGAGCWIRWEGCRGMPLTFLTWQLDAVFWEEELEGTRLMAGTGKVQIWSQNWPWCVWSAFKKLKVEMSRTHVDTWVNLKRDSWAGDTWSRPCLVIKALARMRSGEKL